MNGKPATEASYILRRLPLLIGALMVAALLAYSEEIHREVVAAIALAEPAIRNLPVLGAVLFVVLSAFSAMLLFFSGLLLVPVGVQVWGPTGCFLLLWAGWFLGGVITYTVGRYLGRPAVNWMLSDARIARYENRIPSGGSLLTVVLAQLALPSDISGYFFGLLRFPARIYLGGLAIAELPYALGTVFLGHAFVGQQYVWLLSAAALGLLVLGVVWLRRR